MNCRGVSFRAEPVELFDAEKIVIVGMQVRGGLLAAGIAPEGGQLAEAACQRVDNALRQIVLKREYVSDRPVVAFAP
ncbi:hypothetical protein D9M72_633210 [compost metagenome]